MNLCILIKTTRKTLLRKTDIKCKQKKNKIPIFAYISNLNNVGLYENKLNWQVRNFVLKNSMLVSYVTWEWIQDAGNEDNGH